MLRRVLQEGGGLLRRLPNFFYARLFIQDQLTELENLIAYRQDILQLQHP